MSDQEKILDVLPQIAHAFADAEIHWAVGASLLLYFHGITDVFHDLDLMVSEKDADRAKDVLLGLGAVKENSPSNAQYRTKYFYEFQLSGIEIDMLAGMIIVSHGQEYDCSFQPQNIEAYVELKDEKIPLYSVSEWRRFYQWMGRTKKVEMIDEAVKR